MAIFLFNFGFDSLNENIKRKKRTILITWINKITVDFFLNNARREVKVFIIKKKMLNGLLDLSVSNGFYSWFSGPRFFDFSIQ